MEAMMSIKITEENDVTVDSVYEIFKSAFMKAVEPDGDALAVDFGTHRVLITVTEESKLLIFSTVILLEYGSPDEAIIWANELNRIQEIVQFYIAAGPENTLYLGARCSMSYEIGIIPFQVINMAKQFHEISSKSISNFIEKHKG